MIYLWKIIIIIIYTIQSTFALGLGFLWHHETSKTSSTITSHSTEESCEQKKTCCAGKMNSCITICFKREHGIQNNKYLEVPEGTKKENNSFQILAQQSVYNTPHRNFRQEDIPEIKGKILVGITKIVV